MPPAPTQQGSSHGGMVLAALRACQAASTLCWPVCAVTVNQQALRAASKLHHGRSQVPEGLWLRNDLVLLQVKWGH